MGAELDRRQFLGGFGCGAAGVATSGWALEPQAFSPAPTDAARLHSLTERLRSATRDACFGVAGEAIAAGAQPRDLLAAVLLAGIQDVKPQHVGGKLHCVMTVESYFQLIEGAPVEEAFVAALLNLDDLKASQARDVREEGDWTLGRAPEVRFPTEAAARMEFLAAMSAWDEERADRALVGLLPFHSHKTLFEILWPLGARSFVDIGHKIIYTVQLERVLNRLDWAHAQPVLRSLVLALLHFGRRKELDAWEGTQEVAARLAKRVAKESKDSADESEALLRALRGLNRTDSRAVVAEAVASGLGLRSIWDGLRLSAAEVFYHRRAAEGRGGLLPVHAVTVVNAFGHAFRSTESDSNKLRLLLQSAAWLSDLREFLIGRDLLKPGAPGLDLLPAEVTAPRRRLLRTQLLRQAEEHHQPKLAAAALEESRLAHPRWQRALLAPVVPYLPIKQGPATDVYLRAKGAIAAAR